MGAGEVAGPAEPTVVGEVAGLAELTDVVADGLDAGRAALVELKATGTTVWVMACTVVLVGESEGT